MAEPLTVAQVRETLVCLLVGALGKTHIHWAGLIEIRILNVVFNVEGNWRVTASGTDHEIAMINEAARMLAAISPYAYE